jgi:hypothetical protein
MASDHRFQLHLWRPGLANNTTVTIEQLAEDFLDQIWSATGVKSSLVKIYDNYNDEKNKTLSGVIVPFPASDFGNDGQIGLVIFPSSATMKTNLKQVSYASAGFNMYIGRFTRIRDKSGKVLSAKYFSRQLFFTTVTNEVKNSSGKITQFEGNFDCQPFGGVYYGWTLMEGKKGYLDINMDSGIDLPMQYGDGASGHCYCLGVKWGSATNQSEMQKQCEKYKFFDGFVVNRFSDEDDVDGENEQGGNQGNTGYGVAGLLMSGVVIEPGNGMIRDKFSFKNLSVKYEIKNDTPIVADWTEHK